MLGVLLALPAVGAERALDDYILALAALGEPRVAGLDQQRFDLFSFASGSPALNRELMAGGWMLPWWSAPDLKIVFFRPLSSLSHYWDYAAWPDTPQLMYLHSLAWLGALLGVVGLLYRRLEGAGGLAPIAALSYALNDANGAVVAWLSNRNALLATCFGAMALLAHDGARRRGRRVSGWSLLWLGCALGAGEMGLCMFGYLAAYSLVLERGGIGQRCAALWPYAGLGVAWIALYPSTGAGTASSGVYLHPVRDFAAFSAAFPGRLTALLGAALGPVPSDLSFFGATEQLPLWIGSGAIAAVAAAVAGGRVLRGDRKGQFWALGMLLSVLPVTAAFPSDRLLLPANLGAMALVARAMRAALSPPAEPRSRSRRALGLALLAVHGVLAPLLLPLRAGQIQALSHAIDRAFAGLAQIPDLERRTLLVLGGPSDFFIGYLQAERAWKGLPRPQHLYWLSSAGGALDLRVTGERSLSLARASGFFDSPPERLYRPAGAPLHVGDEVRLPMFTARVTSLTPQRLPSRVEFELAEPLESERYAFLLWQGERYVRVSAAALRQAGSVPGSSLPQLLFRFAAEPS